MAKNTYHINTSKRNQKQICDHLETPCIYRGSDYGLSSSLTGKGVKISIIDSGVPDHPDINNICESIDMSDSSKDKSDHHGHATMISGMITSNNPRAVCGIAPDAELYFVKAVTPNGECSFNAIVAGVLWSIVKQVDIILVSLGSQSDYSVLHDAIRKAYEQNICIVAAAGNKMSTEYPASYPEVISVSRLSGVDVKAGKFQSSPYTGVEMVIPDNEINTTYLHGRYTKAGGTSLTAALGAGLAALIIERFREKGTYTPNSVYSELASLSYKPLIK